MQEPWQCIVNPAAGSGRAGRDRMVLGDALRAHGVVFEEHITQGPGHAGSLAREAWLAGRRKFLVAGGDGTVNEVFNGLYTGGVPERQPVIAPAPLGSGNDWARSRGLYLGIERVVEKLACETYQPCAAGVLRGVCNGEHWSRYFLNSVGIGLDVCVLQRLPPWRITALRYAVGLLRAFAAFSAREVRVVADGVERRDVALVNLCALGPYSGGGMCLAPHAAAEPEQLAVLWVEDVSWPRLLLSGRRIYDGTLGDLPEVSLYHAARVEFRAPAGEALQADGEFVGETPAVAEILPAALLTLAHGG